MPDSYSTLAATIGNLSMTSRIAILVRMNVKLLAYCLPGLKADIVDCCDSHLALQPATTYLSTLTSIVPLTSQQKWQLTW